MFIANQEILQMPVRPLNEPKTNWGLACEAIPPLEWTLRGTEEFLKESKSPSLFLHRNKLISNMCLVRTAFAV